MLTFFVRIGVGVLSRLHESSVPLHRSKKEKKKE